MENPQHTGRGVVRLLLDGDEVGDGWIPLRELSGRRQVRVTLGTAGRSTQAGASG